MKLLELWCLRTLPVGAGHGEESCTSVASLFPAAVVQVLDEPNRARVPVDQGHRIGEGGNGEQLHIEVCGH